MCPGMSLLLLYIIVSFDNICSVETDVAPPCDFLGHEVFCGVHKLLRLKAEYKFFIKNDRYLYLLTALLAYVVLY